MRVWQVWRWVWCSTVQCFNLTVNPLKPWFSANDCIQNYSIFDSGCVCVLQRIHEVQELMADTEAWNRIGTEQQQARSRQLSADERQCRYTQCFYAGTRSWRLTVFGLHFWAFSFTIYYVFLSFGLQIYIKKGRGRVVKMTL